MHVGVNFHKFSRIWGTTACPQSTRKDFQGSSCLPGEVDFEGLNKISDFLMEHLLSYMTEFTSNTGRPPIN